MRTCFAAAETLPLAPHKALVLPLAPASQPGTVHFGLRAMWAGITEAVPADSVAANPAAGADADLSTADAVLVDEIGGVAQSKVSVGKLETFKERSGVVASGKAEAGGQVKIGVGGAVRRDLK